MNRQPSTPVCLAKVSDQVHHHAYGHGVIVAIAKGLPVIRFYGHDGFHGRRPLIVSSPYRVIPPVVVTLRKVTDSDPTPDSESYTPRTESDASPMVQFHHDRLTENQLPALAWFLRRS